VGCRAFAGFLLLCALVGTASAERQTPSLGKILSSLRTASKKDDALGAKIAVDQLKRYKQTHDLGLWDRFRIWRTEGKVLDRIKYAGRRQNIQSAAENVALLISIKGDNDPKSKRAIQLLHKYAIKTAEHHARNGSPPGAQQALEMARQASAAGGPAFDQAKAEKIMRFAYKRGVGAYVWQARVAYKKGDVKDAAMMLLESLEIQNNPQLGYRPGFFARRQLAKLMRKLGPHVAEAREAKAAQMQAQMEAMQKAEAEAQEQPQEQGEAGEGEPPPQAQPQAQPSEPRPRFVAPVRPANTKKDALGRPMPSSVEVVEPVGPSPFDPGPG
jgi:hypothetical protein